MVFHFHLDWFIIESKHSGLVVDVAASEHGAKIITYSEHGGDNQLWRWEGFCIVSKLGLALDVEASGSEPGTNVVSWTHHGGDNQKWRIQGDKIISEANGMALDIEGGSHDEETPLITWPLHSETEVDNQSWRIKYV